MAGKEVYFQLFTGEGVIVDSQKMTIDAAKEKCRENLSGNCARDLKPCDLAESGKCRQGYPCLIARKPRKSA